MSSVPVISFPIVWFVGIGVAALLLVMLFWKRK